MPPCSPFLSRDVRGAPIILQPEADRLVEGLKPVKLEDIGSKSWYDVASPHAAHTHNTASLPPCLVLPGSSWKGFLQDEIPPDAGEAQYAGTAICDASIGRIRGRGDLTMHLAHTTLSPIPSCVRNACTCFFLSAPASGPFSLPFPSPTLIPLPYSPSLSSLSFPQIFPLEDLKRILSSPPHCTI